MDLLFKRISLNEEEARFPQKELNAEGSSESGARVSDIEVRGGHKAGSCRPIQLEDLRDSLEMSIGGNSKEDLLGVVDTSGNSRGLDVLLVSVSFLKKSFKESSSKVFVEEGQRE